MGYWLKSYTDILDDPKYFRLSANAQLAMHECFLIAKKLEGDEMTGLLPSLEEIAFHSRKSVDFWTEAMKELITCGIVIEHQPGYLIKNYIKRQKPIPPEERMRQFRKKKNSELMDCNDIVTECNENETIRNGEKRREETETETEKRRDREDVEKEVKNDDNPSRKELLATFSKETGMPINGSMKNEDTDALTRMLDVGVDIADLRGGIQFMKDKGFPIVGLKSVVGPTLVEHQKRHTRNKSSPSYTGGKYGKFIKS